MEELTLMQIKQRYNISRRAIQGYENEGLVRPTGKTKRGYLLYDENATRRILQIKQYQDMGFRVKEIGNVIDASAPVVKEALMEKKEDLLKRKDEIAELIDLIDRKIASI